MTVGQRLREVRGKLTLKEFIEPLDVSLTTISTIENDRSGLSVELAVKIAKTYNVSLDWLLMGEEKPPAIQEPAEGYVTISKDELLKMQSELLDVYKKLNTKQELENKQLQEQASQLQGQIQTKNINPVSS